jgi:hypothetical protein
MPQRPSAALRHAKTRPGIGHERTGAARLFQASKTADLIPGKMFQSLPQPRSLKRISARQLQGCAAPTTTENAHQRHVPQDDVNRLDKLAIRPAGLQQNYELDSLFVAANPMNLAKRTRWISMWVKYEKGRAKMRALFK